MTTTTTTTTQPETTPRVLALLVAGHTMHAVAQRAGWPLGAVRKLVDKHGWFVDKNGRIYDPGKRNYRAQLPDEVSVDDLAWARQLLDDAPRTIQFQEPTIATPLQPATDRPAEPAGDGPPPPTSRAADLPLDHIHDHPGNIRDDIGDVTELADSIRAQGLLQPLTVRLDPHMPGHYQLLAGHRRRAAALLAGLTTVPAVIRPDTRDVDTDAAAVEVMLVENVHRTNLSPMEKAEALGRLRDMGYNQERISARTGISSSTVSYLLALTELDDASKERVRSGEPWSWEPDYLAKTHPLARKAARYCEAREHTSRRRIGQIACGQCWESAIREDERVLAAAAAAALAEEAS